jgi:1-acyl-sn-glycerol-3-phosphate acyltransferase
VPVALLGMYELLPMNTYHIKPRPLEMRVGTPIPTAGLDMRDMETLSLRVQTAIEEMYYGSRPSKDSHQV